MLIGKNLIAGEPVDATDASYTARGALAQFEEASSAHVDRALEAAAHAFDSYRALPPNARAAFLDRIAAEIDASDELIDAAHVETGLPRQRLAGERGPTYLIKVSAQQDGSFTVTNTRNGFSKTYRPRS